MRRLAPVVVVATAAVALLGPARADGPVDDSRKAAEQLGFTGLVRLQWTDAGGTHSRRFDVEADGGVIVVKGSTVLMARSGNRLVQRAGQGWDLVWPAELRAPSLPSADRKYVLDQRWGPDVAGRPTVLVDVTRNGVVQERLYVDIATSLILRREELDPAGRARRVVTFERLVITHPALPAAPQAVADRRPRAAAEPKGAFRAPAQLTGGYLRVGSYTRSNKIHVLYSDGVYSLSIFEQRGGLDADDVPAGGRRVQVGLHRGWHYSWAGGEVVVWQAGDGVFTAVGEAPVSDVLAAARSLPAVSSPSNVDKLRRFCRGMLQAFS